MRRSGLFALLVVALLGAIFAPTHTLAQATRTASPPTTKIVLSTIEPRPAAAADVVDFAGGGGGGEIGDQPPVPTWITVPEAYTYPDHSSFYACGYGSGPMPTATLTTPSGHQIALTADPATTDGCWGYSIGWTYGMELGNYKLDLDHPAGKLSYQWRIDYPTCPLGFTLAQSDKAMSVLLAGFQPKQNLVVNFFTTQGQDQGQYLASRPVSTDDQGAALLDVSVSRSAPFVLNSVYYTMVGYDTHVEIITKFTSPGSTLLDIAGQTARVLPGNPNRLRDAPGGTVIGEIPGGASFDVIGTPAVCADNLRWWKVNYNGLIGWTAEGQNGQMWIEPEQPQYGTGTPSAP